MTKIGNKKAWKNLTAKQLHKKKIKRKQDAFRDREVWK